MITAIALIGSLVLLLAIWTDRMIRRCLRCHRIHNEGTPCKRYWCNGHERFHPSDEECDLGTREKWAEAERSLR